MLAWIDGLPRGQRFFLTYLPIAGHHPYATPEHGPFAGTAEIDQYRNALHYGDASLGALIEGLRARGLEQNTVWVVYGDHGEAFHQHEGNYGDRKSTRLNSSHGYISYAVFCLKKK